MSQSEERFAGVLSSNPLLKQYCQDKGITNSLNLISYLTNFPTTSARALGLERIEYEAYSRDVIAELQGRKFSAEAIARLKGTVEHVNSRPSFPRN